MLLIVIDRDDALQCYDNSILKCDAVEEKLIVKPSENEEDFIYISFKRNIMHQNVFQQILCVDECETDSNRYLLVFVNVEKCIKFIGSIKNGKAKDKLLITVLTDDETFKEKYLIPIAAACQKDPSMEEELRPLLLEFLHFYKTNDQIEPSIPQMDDEAVATNNSIEFSNAITTTEIKNVTTEVSNAEDHSDNSAALVLRNSVNQCDYSGNNDIIAAEALNTDSRNNDERRKSLRKHDQNVNYQDTHNVPRPLKRRHPTKSCQQSESCLNNTIYAPNFKLINYNRKGNLISRLFIFSTSDKSMCYEYCYYLNQKRFFCSGCMSAKKFSGAIIENDLNGLNFVKCFQTNHACKLRKFQPEKYQNDLIIKKPNYEIIEEEVKGKAMKYLLLYTSADKQQFYKFTYINSSKSYVCTKCDSPKFKGCRKYINAYIRHDTDGNEFIYVKKQKHICSNMEYLEFEEATPDDIVETSARHRISRSKSKNPIIEKLTNHQHPSNLPPPRDLEKTKIIRKPNFQLFQRSFQGRMIKKLAILNSNDATMCHVYTWSNSKQFYECNSCKNYFHINVCARIIKHGDEEEYVQLGNHNHQCELQKFDC